MNPSSSMLGFEWCTVGDPGNAPMRGGAGNVAFPFEMARFPVTNEQYASFLNALSAEERVTRYTPLMAEHFFGGILCDSQPRVFFSKKGFAKKPVVFVSWFDARRFAQWLSANDTAWDYRLPTRDEWLKAAAFRGLNGWARYVTGEDDAPSQDPRDANSANFYDTRAGWALPAPHVADVDMYRHASYYGTVGQAGNCAEWVDAEMANGWKMALGGSLFRPVESLRTSSFEGDAPEKKLSTFGFRLVRVKKGSAVVQTSEVSELREIGRGDAIRAGSGAGGGEGAYVVVGDPFNLPDSLFGGHGRVNYGFEIARCALSNREYADFLNAVARVDDPFALFHKDMATGVLGGLQKTDDGGRWIYQAKDGWADKPVVYVDYFSVARYANWLHYGRPRTGRSELGSTEGDATRGAYDTRLFARFLSGDRSDAQRIGRRNAGARYWIPNNDEWYKAAYYDPKKPGGHPYWEFPTRSSNLPDNQNPEGLYAANYQRGETFGIGAPYYLADVQAYARASGFYGTLQQGGNVWEWLEDFRRTSGGVLCGLRGGSFGYTETGLHASNEDLVELGTRSYVFGARLARSSTPEGWRSVPTPWRLKARDAWQAFRCGFRAFVREA